MFSSICRLYVHGHYNDNTENMIKSYSFVKDQICDSNFDSLYLKLSSEETVGEFENVLHKALDFEGRFIVMK